MPAYPDDGADTIRKRLGSIPTGSNVSAVATRLLDLFTSGDLTPGTRLPPERQLAETLSVGRSAVREALAALEMLGVVDVRPGSGSYVRGSASELLPQSLSWGILLGERQTQELIEVRGALETYAARLAAERMPEEAITRLGEHLDRMRAAAHDLSDFVDADLQFHHELAASIDNRVLLDLLQIIRSLLRIWADRAVQDAEHAQLAIEEHSAVHAAILARDGDAAASAMAAHMLTAGHRLAALVEPRPAEAR